MKMKSYLKRSALVWWVIAMAVAIVLTASNYASSVGEAFFGSFTMVYALRCVVRFFQILTNVKVENSFGGTLKYGWAVLKALCQCIKPALRWFIAAIIFGLIVESIHTTSYWWMVGVAFVVSVIPWGKKESTTAA